MSTPIQPHPYALHPFESTAATAGLAVRARVERRGQGPEALLLLQYELQASNPSALAAVHWPVPTATPARCDGLWSSTCCEAFLAVVGEEAYWELNLSPTGQWNLYRLAGYRQDLTPDPALQTLPIETSRSDRGLLLRVSLPLGPLGLGTRSFELGITAVLQHEGGALSYWALCHPAAQADFHHRGGFQLRLDP